MRSVKTNDAESCILVRVDPVVKSGMIKFASHVVRDIDRHGIKKEWADVRSIWSTWEGIELSTKKSQIDEDSK